MRIYLLRVSTTATLAILAALLVPAAGAAQSELDSSEAEAFLGDWVMPLDTPQGSVEMAIMIQDRDGKVTVHVGSEHGSEEIKDVQRAGEGLVLSYLLQQEGMTLPISMTLRPNGGNLNARLDIGAGMFTFDGMARPADG